MYIYIYIYIYIYMYRWRRERGARRAHPRRMPREAAESEVQYITVCHIIKYHII